MPLTWHIVEDRNAFPSQYGVAGALLASALASDSTSQSTSHSTDAHVPGSPVVAFAHLPFQIDTDHYPDGCQHVAMRGPLLPSGLVHFERLTGASAPQPVDLTALLSETGAAMLGTQLGHSAPSSESASESTPGRASQHDAVTDLVISIHPGVTLPVLDADDLASQCARHGIAYRLYRTEYHGRQVEPSGDLSHERSRESIEADLIRHGGTCAMVIRRDDDGRQFAHVADAFGRWNNSPHNADMAGARDASHASSRSNIAYADDRVSARRRRTVRIALIGAESVQREEYPATMASLADAADFQGLALQVDFIDPTLLVDDERALHRRLSQYHGVLLPGGADMRRVPGMIAVCKTVWHEDLPTLGLCLGMQAMVTEAVQRSVGNETSTLPEFDPDTALPSFVPIERYRQGGNSLVTTETASRSADRQEHAGVVAGASDFHRLGVHALRVRTRKHRLSWMHRANTIHCNHRYMLSPVLTPKILQAGLDLVAWTQDEDSSSMTVTPSMPSPSTPSLTKRIVDVIVANSRRFYVGYQGHPELMSRSDAPHPALLAFLRVATKKAIPGRRTRSATQKRVTRRWPLQIAKRQRSRPRR